MNQHHWFPVKDEKAVKDICGIEIDDFIQEMSGLSHHLIEDKWKYGDTIKDYLDTENDGDCCKLLQLILDMVKTASEELGMMKMSGQNTWTKTRDVPGFGGMSEPKFHRMNTKPRMDNTDKLKELVEEKCRGCPPYQRPAAAHKFADKIQKYKRDQYQQPMMRNGTTDRDVEAEEGAERMRRDVDYDEWYQNRDKKESRKQRKLVEKLHDRYPRAFHHRPEPRIRQPATRK